MVYALFAKCMVHFFEYTHCMYEHVWKVRTCMLLQKNVTKFVVDLIESKHVVQSFEKRGCAWQTSLLHAFPYLYNQGCCCYSQFMHGLCVLHSIWILCTKKNYDSNFCDVNSLCQYLIFLSLLPLCKERSDGCSRHTNLFGLCCATYLTIMSSIDFE